MYHPYVSDRKLTPLEVFNHVFCPRCYAFILLLFSRLVFDFVTVRDLPVAIRNSYSCTLPRMAIPLVSSFQSLCFSSFLHLRYLICFSTHRTFLRVSRDSPLLLFVIELILQLSLFLSFAASLYSLTAPTFFCLSLSLSLSHASLRILVLYFLLSLPLTPSHSRSRSLDLFPSISFFFILRHPQSHLSRLPFPRPFLFILPLICLFPHPSNPLFRAHSLRLAPFHASFPPSSVSSLRFVLSPFSLPSSPPTPAATFSNSSLCFAVLDLL